MDKTNIYVDRGSLGAMRNVTSQAIRDLIARNKLPEPDAYRRVIRKDGTVFPVELRAFLVRDRDGRRLRAGPAPLSAEPLVSAVISAL